MLATIAARHGFTAEEVISLVHDPNESALTRQEVKDAVRRGIRSVPVFLLNNRHVLAGAQPETVFRDAIVHAIKDRIDVDLTSTITHLKKSERSETGHLTTP